MTERFADHVRRIVAGIPAGQVRTYGQVARAAGSPNAARAVGAVMRANRDPHVPCHRVVASDGSLGGYNGGLEEKRRKLRAEGHAV